MAAWRGDENTIDWALVRSGGVTLFFKPEVLKETTDWLSQHRYRIVQVDASQWSNESAMHADLASALDFPSYYGNNLSALTDCLRDVVDQHYGWEPADTGLILVIHRFDDFHSREPELAWLVLDIIAGAHHDASLIGNRILCLVQSNDPGLDVPALGGNVPLWNGREWLDSSRFG